VVSDLRFSPCWTEGVEEGREVDLLVLDEVACVDLEEAVVDGVAVEEVEETGVDEVSGVAEVAGGEEGVAYVGGGEEGGDDAARGARL
jgi:hypothetical protein